MERKHTPKPWIAYAQGDGLWAVRSQETNHRVAKDVLQSDALQIAAAPDLLEAATLLEAAEEFHCNSCPECQGETEPERCGTCFPKFDEARIARRKAIAKATGGK
jgi:hypothetical protein